MDTRGEPIFSCERRHEYSLGKTSYFSQRHASNELDSFVLVQGQHCQAELPPFDACQIVKYYQ